MLLIKINNSTSDNAKPSKSKIDIVQRISKRQCISYSRLGYQSIKRKIKWNTSNLRFREFVDRTVNEFAIAHENTFKKLARRNVPILRFHTLSNHVGAVEDRMNRGYWPMKSSWSPLRGSVFAVMGRQPRQDRSLQKTVLVLFRIFAVSRFFEIFQMFRFSVSTWSVSRTRSRVENWRVYLVEKKNRAIGFEMFMDRSLFDNWVSLLRVIMAFNVEKWEGGRKRRGRGGDRWNGRRKMGKEREF